MKTNGKYISYALNGLCMSYGGTEITFLLCNKSKFSAKLVLELSTLVLFKYSHVAICQVETP